MRLPPEKAVGHFYDHKAKDDAEADHAQLYALAVGQLAVARDDAVHGVIERGAGDQRQQADGCKDRCGRLIDAGHDLPVEAADDRGQDRRAENGRTRSRSTSTPSRIAALWRTMRE